MATKKKSFQHPFGNICGVTGMGERGQVVIPVEARKLLKTKAGDQFVVFEHDGFLILLPEKMVSKMMEKMTRILRKK